MSISQNQSAKQKLPNLFQNEEFALKLYPQKVKLSNPSLKMIAWRNKHWEIAGGTVIFSGQICWPESIVILLQTHTYWHPFLPTVCPKMIDVIAHFGMKSPSFISLNLGVWWAAVEMAKHFKTSHALLWSSHECSSDRSWRPLRMEAHLTTAFKENVPAWKT